MVRCFVPCGSSWYIDGLEKQLHQTLKHPSLPELCWHVWSQFALVNKQKFTCIRIFCGTAVATWQIQPKNACLADLLKQKVCMYSGEACLCTFIMCSFWVPEKCGMLRTIKLRSQSLQNRLAGMPLQMYTSINPRKTSSLSLVQIELLKIYHYFSCCKVCWKTIERFSLLLILLGTELLKSATALQRLLTTRSSATKCVLMVVTRLETMIKSWSTDNCKFPNDVDAPKLI